MSNIWTAASEGDLARVQACVEGGLSPSVPDENTYTPLHAAASWGHADILRYLVGKGGDINVVDSDGETPLFVVETAEMARTVVELGGDPALLNSEGISAAESLQEDYPHISIYLRTLTGEDAPSSTSDPSLSSTTDAPRRRTLNPDLDSPTDDLLLRVRQIMEASERGALTSDETDAKLREVVESSVLGQVAVGREIGEAMELDGGATTGIRRRGEDANGDVIEEEDDVESTGAKRRREEPGR